MELFELLLMDKVKKGSSGGGGFSGVTYNGARVGANHFSSTNKLESTDLVQFLPGTTMVIVVDHQAAAVAGNEALMSSGRGFFGTGIGYSLAIGQFTDDLYLVNYAGAFVLLASGLRIGINTIVIKYKADTSWVTSINGLTVTTAAGIGTLSYDGSCFTEIGQGSPTDSQAPMQSGGVLAWGLVNEELSDADVRLYSGQVGSVNRLIVPPAVTALASSLFDWNAYRDWNGIASTSVSQGSSPVTFTVGGTVTRTDFSEIRYATVDAMYWDSAISTPTTSDYGETFTRRNSYARLNVTTSADRVSFEGGGTANNGTFGDNYSSIGVYSNGTFVSQHAWQTGDLVSCRDAMLSAGSDKSVDVNEGMQWLQSFPRGTYVTAIRIRVGSTLNAPSAQAHWVGMICDSIGEGFKATYTRQSPAMLLRYGVASGTTVTIHGWASATTKDFLGDSTLRAAFVAQMVTASHGSTTRKLIVQIGTNDFGLGSWLVSQYKSAWGATIDALQAAMPGFEIIFQSPIQRISPDGEGPNGNAEFLGDFRTAQQELAVAKLLTTYHEGAAGAVVSDANLDGDGLHPSSTGVGSAQLGTAVISYT